MDLGAGRKLTCCGDEPYNSCEEAYAKDSTWLLHEAFCLHGQADIFHPYEIQRKESGIIMAICMCRMIWKKYHYKDENGGCL